MQRFDPYKQIQPYFSGMFFAEFLLMLEHIIVEVHAAGEVLGDDVVVGFGLEEIDYPDDFGYVAGLLQSQHLRLVLQKRFLARLDFEFIHLLDREVALLLPMPGPVDRAPGARPQDVRRRVHIVAHRFQFLVIHC